MIIIDFKSMSNLSTSEANKLGDLPGGLTEVYLESMAAENYVNDIEHFQLAPEFSHLAYEQSTQTDKEWSQVFDLEDAALVCIVKAQKLEMRLVHLTDGPLIELREFVMSQNNDAGLGGGPAAGSYLNSPFVTEQDIMANLYRTSKRFEKANMSFDAPIVPNLCLIENKNRYSANDRQAAMAIRPAHQNRTLLRRSPEQCQYTLALASQTNRVYYVHFERFYLEKGYTVFVEPSDDKIFEHLQGQKIRCFEQIHDFINKRDLFVIGSAAFVPPQSSLQNGQNRAELVAHTIESTLTFLDAEGSVLSLNHAGQNNANENNQGQGGGAAAYNNAGWLTRLADNLRGLRPGGGWGNQQAAAQQYQYQPALIDMNNVYDKFRYVVGEALLAPQSNIKNLEGVLAFKALTNDLLAVVYTSGLFRVVDISSLAPMLEINLLADEGRLGTESGRLIEAYIAFKTHQSVADIDRISFSKSISFGLVIAVENYRTIYKQYVLHTLSLRFNNVPTMDPVMEDEVLLGRDFDLDHTRQQIFEPGMVITSITACENSAFLYTTFEPQTRETSIFSTSCAQPIWDRGSYELKHYVADKTPISVDILKYAPQLLPALKKHYFERITAPNRFSPESLYAQLAEDRLIDANFSTKENLQKAMEHAHIDNIKRFLANLIELEARNGRILTIGEPLKCQPGWRILVRPLGICVLATTSHISTVEAAINLGSIEKEFYWATHETELLIRYLGLLKTSMTDNLHMFNQRIAESPKTIRQDANKCIMNAKNEQVVQKLRYMLQTSSGDIQDQLDKFFSKVIEKFILSQANRGKPPVALYYPSHNVEMLGGGAGSMAAQQYLTGSSLKALEQIIYYEVSALLQILIDLYLGQILLQNSTQKLKEDQLSKMESWICQISGLQDALNADYAAVQGGKTTKQSSKVPNHLVSSLNSKRSEISRSGSVLKHLLNLSKENPEIMQFNSQGCYEAADVLIKVVKSYTQIDDLTDSAPCHVPILARHLCELNQHQTALNYLKTVRTKSIGVLFAQTLSMACLGEELSVADRQAYMSTAMRLICETLALKPKAQSKIDLQQAFLMKRTDGAKQALRTRIEQLNKISPSNDSRLQYLLLCASELASREVSERGGADAEHCSAFFILRCLQMESPSPAVVTTLAGWCHDEKDYMLYILFDSQRLNVNMLYYAVTNLRKLETRQTYLLKFFEHVRGANRPSQIRSAILSSCPFSQPDITLVVEAIQAKISEMVKPAAGSRRGDSGGGGTGAGALTQKWREEVCNLTYIYHDVAQLYHWQDQFVKFSWAQWETHLTQLLYAVSNSSGSGSGQTSQMRQVLSVAQFSMTLALTASQSCGKDFYFHSSQSVANSKDHKVISGTGIQSHTLVTNDSRKRSYNEAMNAGRMVVDEVHQQLRRGSSNGSDSFWSEIDQIGSRPAEFNCGKLIRVDHKRLLGVVMLCRAKLVCLDEMPSAACYDSPLYLSKVLVELGKTDLAVELALANNVSPAFAIASQLDRMKNVDIRDGEDEEEEAMRYARIDECIERYLGRVKAEHLGELAQYLIALRVTFSNALKQRLIQQKQVAYVIGCYLSPEVEDVVRAVDFLMFGDDESDEEAARILIHSDLNQVVNLLQMAYQAQEVFEEEKRRLEGDREVIQNYLAKSYGLNRPKILWRADSVTSMSGLADLQAAMSDNNVISAILAEDAAAQYSQFESTTKIEKDLKKCIYNLESLKIGSAKIKQVLKNVLSKQRR